MNLDVTNWRIEEAFAIHLQLGSLDLSQGWIQKSPLTHDHSYVKGLEGLQTEEKVCAAKEKNRLVQTLRENLLRRTESSGVKSNLVREDLFI
ncbi:hypothetical protein CARUB_v10018315mg [Capsella rubella]|uniref:Uncharacterized protein n=1 Tax=Capsella rubella TaxID=81985 RepID=R0FR37_9BRAS|nr:hypothetical protein CARUB_v10018315mg [Capsella rubella]